MKHSFLALFAIVVMVGCSWQQPTDRASHNRLYTSSDINQITKSPSAKTKNKNIYFDKFLAFGKPVSDLESQIIMALCGRESSTPLVLFIHGRGDNMEKTEKKRIVHNLERNYDIAVVQFHWQSQNINGWTSYPAQQSIDSAPNLIKVLRQLEIIRNRPNDILAGRKVHMLAHSMGNLMIREIGSVPLIQPENVIDNLILNAPDVPLEGAEVWLKELKFSQNITVVHYNLDFVLGVSKWLLTGRTKKLGLDYQPISGISGYKAEARGFSHPHFGQASVEKSNRLKAWFKAKLN